MLCHFWLGKVAGSRWMEPDQESASWNYMGEVHIQQRLLLVADGDDDVLKTNTFLPPSQDVIDHNRVITSNVSTIELR